MATIPAGFSSYGSALVAGRRCRLVVGAGARLTRVGDACSCVQLTLFSVFASACAVCFALSPLVHRVLPTVAPGACGHTPLGELCGSPLTVESAICLAVSATPSLPTLAVGAHGRDARA